MTQNERLDFLLHYLIKERKEYENIRVPDSHSEKPVSYTHLDVYKRQVYEDSLPQVLSLWDDRG